MNTGGAIAEAPVKIRNIFKLPFFFFASTISTIPRIKNKRPRIPTRGNRKFFDSEGTAKKVTNNKKIASIE